jgi:hypothetical protein
LYFLIREESLAYEKLAIMITGMLVMKGSAREGENLLIPLVQKWDLTAV